MSKQIIVKYFQESDFAKEPIQVTDGVAGYDLFAAEAGGQFQKDFFVKFFLVHL